MGKVGLKDEDGATKDLNKALEVVPGDANIIRALKNVELAQRARMEKERHIGSQRRLDDIVAWGGVG